MKKDYLIDESLCERYLDLLDIDSEKPGIEALNRLVSAHMMRIPFENISKLFYLKRHNLRNIPTFTQYLDGIEKYSFGGTCHSNNNYLNQLLAYLGYDVRLCGADMTQPDVHIANIVAVEGREFLIDACYAAPFLYPLPRDLSVDYEIKLGRDRYVLHPADENGRSRLDLYRYGELNHGYTVNPTPRQFDYFTATVENSFREDAGFLNSLLLVRLYENRSVVVHNMSVFESHGEDYTTTNLKSREVLPPVIERHFSIPREIVAEAIADMGELKTY